MKALQTNLPETGAELSIKEMFQNRERDFLSRYGTLSLKATRRSPETTVCNIRTPFQLDRDRIVYSNSFRRLKYKTQVFLSPLGIITGPGSPIPWRWRKSPETLPGPCA